MNSSFFKEFETEIVKLSNKINELYIYRNAFINLNLEENKIYLLLSFFNKTILYKKNLHFTDEELEIIFIIIYEQKGELSYSNIFISLCERIILKHIPKFVIEFVIELEYKIIEEIEEIEDFQEVNNIKPILESFFKQLPLRLKEFVLDLVDEKSIKSLIDEKLIKNSMDNKLDIYLSMIKSRNKVNVMDGNILIQNINNTIKYTFSYFSKIEPFCEEYKEIVKEIFIKLNKIFLEHNFKKSIERYYREIFKDKYIQYEIIYDLSTSISMTYEYFKRIKLDNKIKETSYKSLIIINIFKLLSNDKRYIQNICTNVINRKTFYKYYN